MKNGNTWSCLCCCSTDCNFVYIILLSLVITHLCQVYSTCISILFARACTTSAFLITGSKIYCH